MRNRLPILVTAAALSLWALFGCLPSSQADLFRFEREPAFNDRIRLDRNRDGLEDAQRGLDPTIGAFRDGWDANGGESEVVSELYPDWKNCPSRDPIECPTEKLVQPDCYWVAARNSFTGFESVAMSWEAVVQFAAGTFVNELDDAGRLKEFGACRAADPVTGERAILDVDEYSGDGSEVLLPGFENNLDAISAPKGPFELDLGFDLPFTVVELSAVEPASDDGTCPARASLSEPWRPFPGPATHSVFTFETVEPPWDTSNAPRGSVFCRPLETTDTNGAVVSRHYPACAYRCGTAPLRDGSMRLSIRVEEAGQGFDVERFLQPNLLVVPGRRKTARPMADDGSSLAWQTPVLGNAETGLRWHENWSPNVLVESVRVYELLDGKEVAPALDDRGSGPELRFGGHTCLGTVAKNGVVFPIFNPEEEPREVRCDIGAETLLTTPGYLLEDLRRATSPIVTPLRWEVVPVERPRGEVFLELTLRTETAAETAVQVRSVVDFGKQELGVGRSELVVVRNAGSTAVTIDRAWIGGGAHRAEFSARTLGNPVMVPLPADLGRDDGAFTVGLIPGHETDLDPLYQASPGYGQPHARLRTDDHGGGLAWAYGEQVDFSDGYGRLAAPPALFPVVAAADRHLFAGFPVHPELPLPISLRPGATFKVAVTAEPQGWGERLGELWIEGYPAADPSRRFEAISQLVVEGAGADPRGTPEVLVFPLRGSTTRSALLENAGSLPVVRQAFSIAGPQAQVFKVESSHPSTQDIGPGESELFRVRYDPRAAQLPAGSDHHEGLLEVATSQGLVTYELRAFDPVKVTPARLDFVGGVTELELELTNRSFEQWVTRELPFFTSGPNARRFTATATGPIFPNGLLALGPGQSETIRVEYRPRCFGDPATATLHLPTDWGTVLVELEGEAASCIGTR